MATACPPSVLAGGLGRLPGGGEPVVVLPCPAASAARLAAAAWSASIGALDRCLEAVEIVLLAGDAGLGGIRLGAGGRLIVRHLLALLLQERLAVDDHPVEPGDVPEQRLVDAGRPLEHLHLVDEVADRPGGQHVGDRVLVTALVVGGQAGRELLLGGVQVLARQIQRLGVPVQRGERVLIALVDEVVGLDLPLGRVLQLRQLSLGGPRLGLLLLERRRPGRNRRWLRPPASR